MADQQAVDCPLLLTRTPRRYFGYICIYFFEDQENASYFSSEEVKSVSLTSLGALTLICIGYTPCLQRNMDASPSCHPCVGYLSTYPFFASKRRASLSQGQPFSRAHLSTPMCPIFAA